MHLRRAKPTSTRTRPMKTSPSGLNRIKMLVDLGTEDSLADLWSEFGLTPGQAVLLLENPEPKERLCAQA